MPSINAETGGDAAEDVAIYQAVVARISVPLGTYPGIPRFGTNIFKPQRRGFALRRSLVQEEVIASLAYDNEWYALDTIAVSQDFGGPLEINMTVSAESGAAVDVSMQSS